MAITGPSVQFWVELFGEYQPTAPIQPLPEMEIAVDLQVLSAPLIAEIQLAADFEFSTWSLFIHNAVQSAKINALSQELVAENIVTLFELDLTRYNAGIARFVPDVTENRQAIRWGGHTYYPMPVSATGFERKSGGTASRPTLSVSNVSNLFSGLIREAKDIVGCEIRRYRTFRRFLDDGAEPSTTDCFPVEIWRIERKARQNKLTVDFELANILDQEGSKIPKRQILRDYCSYIYRLWDEEKGEWSIDAFDPCPYAGSDMFDEKGEPTLDPKKDICGKRVADCKLRFGANNRLYTRAFPGAGRVR